MSETISSVKRLHMCVDIHIRYAYKWAVYEHSDFSFHTFIGLCDTSLSRIYYFAYEDSIYTKTQNRITWRVQWK